MKLSVQPKIAIPLSILAAGIVGATVLVTARAKVETQPPELAAPLVRVQTVQPRDVRLDVQARGTVQPRTETKLIAAVEGRILWVSPSLVAGGFFEAGEPLIRIDPTDYELAVARTTAAFESAASRLALARKTLERNQTLAKSGAASTIALDDAETTARVASSSHREAQAALQQARRNLERTEIQAPFEGRVRTESVDVGEFVTRGKPLATLYAVDFAEVRLPLPDSQLAFLDLDLTDRRLGNERIGPEVDLRATFAGQERRWHGRVSGTEGEIDSRSRMVHVIVRVEEPYGAAAAASGAPLAVGLFVDATIHGRTLADAIVLPRNALRSKDRVLVVDAEDRLDERTVGLARKSGDDVILSHGLRAGDRVLLSNLEGASAGLKVRTVEETP